MWLPPFKKDKHKNIYNICTQYSSTSTVPLPSLLRRYRLDLNPLPRHALRVQCARHAHQSARGPPPDRSAHTHPLLFRAHSGFTTNISGRAYLRVSMYQCHRLGAVPLSA